MRSSSNVEDLAGMSGAGLYDSISNVPVGYVWWCMVVLGVVVCFMRCVGVLIACVHICVFELVCAYI